MARHFKVLDVLSEPDRPEYEALLRDPRTTVDSAFEWLQERGYKVSRGAVWNHRANFEDTLKGVRQSAELAKNFAQVAKDSGIEGLSDAALSRFQQLMMEKLFQMSSEEELDAGELMKLSIAMNSAVSAKQRVEKLKSEYDARQKAAIAAAEKTAASGGGGDAVVAKVREILGIQ